LGLIVWIVAGRDLFEMEAKKMESSGKSATENARACGMIAFAISLPISVFVLAWIVANWGIRAGG
jgi:hypothetical protein